MAPKPKSSNAIWFGFKWSEIILSLHVASTVGDRDHFKWAVYVASSIKYRVQVNPRKYLFEKNFDYTDHKKIIIYIFLLVHSAAKKMLLFIFFQLRCDMATIHFEDETALSIYYKYIWRLWKRPPHQNKRPRSEFSTMFTEGPRRLSQFCLIIFKPRPESIV